MRSEHQDKSLDPVGLWVSKAWLGLGCSLPPRTVWQWLVLATNCRCIYGALLMLRLQTFFVFASFFLILYQLCGLRCIKINIRVTHWSLLVFCGDLGVSVRYVSEWKEVLQQKASSRWWSGLQLVWKDHKHSFCAGLPGACASVC